MTGRDKKQNYPETYLIRLDSQLKKKLKKVGAKKVREFLEQL